MEQDLEKKTKEIIGQIQCPHESCCIETGFDKSCKVRDVGLKEYIVCLEEDASLCQFLVTYGSTCFCSCPLRIYICKKLGK
jgi:hypothetical protein